MIAQSPPGIGAKEQLVPALDRDGDVFILNLGDGAFIGAGAVATEDVPEQVLVVGIPAKFKKRMS